MSRLSDPIEWLRFAQADLAASRLLLTDAELPFRLACFHAQQAAEKALKAALVRGAVEFRRTHDLVVLAGLQTEPLRSQVSTLDLQLLQQWAVDGRYPADLPDITSIDAASALAIAEQIVEAVMKLFGSGSQSAD